MSARGKAPVSTGRYVVTDPIGLEHEGETVAVADLPLSLSREELVAALYGTLGLTPAEVEAWTATELVQDVVHTIVWDGMDRVLRVVESLRSGPPSSPEARVFLVCCERRVIELFPDASRAVPARRRGVVREFVGAVA